MGEIAELIASGSIYQEGDRWYSRVAGDRLAEVISDSIDAAWAEAEAALPKGWLMVQARRMRVGPGRGKKVWWAEAVAAKSDMGPHVQPQTERAEAQDLPAALRTLAAKLKDLSQHP